jgi:deoxyribodipyrimidine photo-lyase
MYSGKKLFLAVVLLMISSRRLLLQVHSMTIATSKASSSPSAMSPSTVPGRKTFIFHWFRHGDLRLRDNPALMESVALLQQKQQQSQSCCIVPLFVFDPNVFGNDAHTSAAGYWYTRRTGQVHLKTGVQRAQFLLESVHDLQGQLRDLGSNLAVVHSQGDAATVFDQILTQIQKDHPTESTKSPLVDVTIVCQEEVLKEECDAVRQVQNVLKRHCISNQTCFGNGKVQQVWGSTMYELSDLPFTSSSSSSAKNQQLVDMPDTFTPFRTKVEKQCTIKRPLSPPKANQMPFPSMSSGSGEAVTKLLRDWMEAPLPTLQQLGYTAEQVQDANGPRDARGVMVFTGGERAALARVQDYIWTKNLLKDYFDTRNGMLGADYSTKLSPWLALGCISPRTIAMECRNYESRVLANKSTYWVVFELLWRDYCKFFCLKHGNAIFRPSGITSIKNKWSLDQTKFEAWKNGTTGYPLVDANMREMMATGFMSNRGRQNVCSFLAIDLNHDWRWGADWFESQLLDYDVYSNWYNWCAGAGMTGGRLNRFNIIKQSKDYDANGDYVRTWLPELAKVPNEFVHEPWKMTQFQQLEYGCTLGVDYPHPIIAPFSGGRNSGNGGDAARGGTGPPQMNNKQRKPNRNGKSNSYQTFEMKSVKQGNFRIDK